MTTDENLSMTPDNDKAPQRRKRPRKGPIVGFLLLLFLLAGIGAGAWWYLFLRFEESTDDAYVAGNVLRIMPQVSGKVVAVDVDDNDMVAAGQTLVRLDPVDARLAYERSLVALASAVRDNCRLQAQLRETEAAIRMRRVDLRQKADNLTRREALGKAKAIGAEELKHARDDRENAAVALAAAEEERNALAAVLLDTGLAEQPAVRQAAAKAGARQVTVIEEPMAAAIGAGLPTAEPVGSMIVDIGGGTAEVAVISLSGIVASRSVRCAGDALDQSITSFIKRKYNLLVGERTAEQIKLEIGSACPPDPTDTEHGETTMEIKGRNLVDGLPKDILIRSEEVREAMNENLMRIVEAIKDTLECTPPELSSDIIDRGIMLSGGGALLRGLDTLIQNETGIEVHIAEAPLDCVALGAGAVLDHPDLAGTRREELSYL